MPTGYGVRLHWDPNTEPDLARHTVYRGEVYEDEEERVCLASAVEWLSPGTTEYFAERLPDGEEGCYFVDATDTSGNSLFLSERETNVVEFKELDLTPSVGTPEGSPVGLTAHAVSDGVRLGWNDVADAVGYLVYRWDLDTGRYEGVTPEPVTGTAWTDTTAARGTTHFYWVRAVYADGTESLPGGGHAILTP